MFSPLLCEMEELGTTLNLEEFLDASFRLYNVITHIFLNDYDIDTEHTRKESDTKFRAKAWEAAS